MFCVIGPELEVGVKNREAGRHRLSHRGCALASWRGCCGGLVRVLPSAMVWPSSLDALMAGEKPQLPSLVQGALHSGLQTLLSLLQTSMPPAPQRRIQLAPHHPGHRGSSRVPEYSMFPMSCLLCTCPSGLAQEPHLCTSPKLFPSSCRWTERIVLAFVSPSCGSIY